MTKTRANSRNPVQSNLYIVPYFRISGQLPAPVVNGEEIASKNGRMSNFEGLLTLILTFHRVILHTVVRHSSTSTHTPNFIEIEETFCGRTDGRTYVRTHVHTYLRTDGH